MGKMNGSYLRCPTCGRYSKHKIGQYSLTRMQWLLFNAVKNAPKVGISSPSLVEKMYEDREDGGPLFARDCMYVTIYRLNAKLAGQGLRIVSRTKKGTTGIYVLREVRK